MPPPVTEHVRECPDQCHVGFLRESLLKHRRKYHHPSVEYKDPEDGGRARVVYRDNRTGLLKCPCGDRLHARYSEDNFRNIQTHEPGCHPAEKDVYADKFPSGLHCLPSEDVSFPIGFQQPDSDQEDDRNEDAGYEENISNSATSPPHTPEPEATDEPSPACSPEPTDDLDDGDYQDSINSHWDYSPPPSPEASDSETDNDTTEDDGRDEGVDATLVETATLSKEESAQKTLRRWSVYVHPIYRCVICVECAVILASTPSGHRTKKHPRPLPPQNLLENALHALGIDRDSSWTFPAGLIPQIEGVKLSEGYMCPLFECRRGYTVKSSAVDHIKKVHGGNTAGEPKPAFFHRTGGSGRCVEVVPRSLSEVESSIDDGSILQDILEAHQPQATPGISSQDLPAKYADPLLRATGWSTILQGAKPSKLRASVQRPSDAAESILFRLWKHVILRYYHWISQSFDKVTRLVRQHIHSAESTLVLRPFGKPQESSTIMRYAQSMGIFLCFLLRRMDSPINSYPVPIHPTVRKRLETLQDALGDVTVKDDNTVLLGHVHDAVWALLTCCSKESLDNPDLDLFNLYLAATSVRMDNGAKVSVHILPPRISAIQWCLRATATEEFRRQRKHQIKDLEVYKTHIEPYLKQTDQTLFSTMRQLTIKLSTLSRKTPRESTLYFDAPHKLIIISDTPIKLRQIYTSITHGIREVQRAIEEIADGADLSPVFAYIQKHIDPRPANSSNWFKHDPRAETFGMSIFDGDDGTGLAKFTNVLLSHFCGGDKYFKRVDNVLTPQDEIIWDFIHKLDDIVAYIYFLVTMTSGGPPRGTESEGLRREDTSAGQRNLMIFNNLLSLVYTYSKTQQAKGFVETIIRTPPVALSKLLLVVWGILFPTARELFKFIVPPSSSADANNYRSYLWVQSGKVMKSATFSKTLQYYTAIDFGVPMGNRTIRHFLDCLLKNAIQSSFDSDDVAAAEVDVNVQVGHSNKVADEHHGIQHDAHPDVPSTRIAALQRVSLRWHLALGLLPADYRDALRSSAEAQEEHRLEHMFTKFKSSVKSDVEESIQEGMEQSQAELKMELKSMKEMLAKFQRKLGP